MAQTEQQQQPPELTDQQILELTDQIKREEAARMPLVGEVESIAALREEYSAGSEIYARKINWLEHQGYTQLRRLRVSLLFKAMVESSV